TGKATGQSGGFDLGNLDQSRKLTGRVQHGVTTPGQVDGGWLASGLHLAQVALAVVDLSSQHSERHPCLDPPLPQLRAEGPRLLRHATTALPVASLPACEATPHRIRAACGFCITRSSKQATRAGSQRRSTESNPRRSTDAGTSTKASRTSSPP